MWQFIAESEQIKIHETGEYVNRWGRQSSFGWFYSWQNMSPPAITNTLNTPVIITSAKHTQIERKNCWHSDFTSGKKSRCFQRRPNKHCHHMSPSCYFWLVVCLLQNSDIYNENVFFPGIMHACDDTGWCFFDLHLNIIRLLVTFFPNSDCLGLLTLPDSF